MAHLYVEINEDSRNFSLTKTSIEQKLVLIACLDPTITSSLTEATIFGQNDDTAALEYAYSIVPETRLFPDYDGVVQVCTLEKIDVEDLGQHKWKYTCRYTYDQQRGLGGTQPTGTHDDKRLPYVKIGFKIGGGTKKVKKAPIIVDTSVSILSDLAGIGEIETEGAIGMTPDGIEGVSVPSSSFSLQITAYYLPSFLTQSYANTLCDLAAGKYGMGSYNASTFLNRDAGEVQLLSISGGGTVIDVIPLTFDFSIKRNIDDEPDGGFTNIDALGHDIIDYIFIKKVDPNVGRLILSPDQRQILRVASPEDYDLLYLP